MVVFIVFFQIVLSLHAYALEPIRIQVDQKIPHRNSLGVGSRLTIQIPGKSSKSSIGVFLGKLIDPNGTFNQFMILDETHSRIYFSDKENILIGRYSFQPVLKPYDQIGGTCTGYAINHFIQQMFWSGFEGTGQLEQEISSEKGRTQLLVDAINEYYLVLQHRYSLAGVMNHFGQRFGFKCKTRKFNESEAALRFLDSHLTQNQPVMITFSTGPNMVDSPVLYVDYELPKQWIDSRLWVPRKIGERESGGHSVVAISRFDFKSKPFALMLDSDWAEPRVWDLNSYFNTRTAMDEVEFIACD